MVFFLSISGKTCLYLIPPLQEIEQLQQEYDQILQELDIIHQSRQEDEARHQEGVENIRAQLEEKAHEISESQLLLEKVSMSVLQELAIALTTCGASGGLQLIPVTRFLVL